MKAGDVRCRFTAPKDLGLSFAQFLAASAHAASASDCLRFAADVPSRHLPIVTSAKVN